MPMFPLPLPLPLPMDSEAAEAADVTMPKASVAAMIFFIGDLHMSVLQTHEGFITPTST